MNATEETTKQDVGKVVSGFFWMPGYPEQIIVQLQFLGMGK